MQAGNRLSFVEPFSLEERKEISTGAMTETLRYFLEMCGKLLKTHDEAVDTAEILEESGFVTVFELSLRVPADDGSYLHVLVFGHKQESALLDLGVSLIEHGPKGEYISGYQYIAEGIEVRRSSTRATLPDSEDDSADDRTLHFSVIDLYAAREELHDIQQSEDEEVRLEAADIWSGLVQEAEFDEWEEEMGFDNQPIDKGELEKVAAVIVSAELFPLPRQTEDDGTVY
ncbi:MAG: hypothetical protein WAO28_00575 [Candidatus Microsaccharimonas sp.]